MKISKKIKCSPPDIAGNLERKTAPLSEQRIALLAVSGMSPAILTETIWALAHPADGQPPVIPDDVIVITTTRARSDLERDLLQPDSGNNLPSIWQQLRHAILGPEAAKSSKLSLATPRVIEIPDASRGIKVPASDLRTAGENRAAADFMLEEIRRLVENPDIRVIASIAGGRKTMGALLYACMSLLARETDRLTHVLVREPFDDPRLKPRFFFPSQQNRPILMPDGQLLSPDSAVIELADIPFVPLRNLFERELIKKPGSFGGLVDRCRQRVIELTRSRVTLEMSESKQQCLINGISVQLSGWQFVVLYYLASRASQGLMPLLKYIEAVEELQYMASQMHSRRRPNNYSDWRFGLANSDSALNDDQRIRKLLNELKKHFQANPQTAAIIPYLPQRGRFSLDLDKSSIVLHP